MRPSRFTWPFHSNCTEYYTKSNNILEEDNFLHHMTPTSVSYVQIKSLYLNVFSIIFLLGGDMTKSCWIGLPAVMNYG